MFQRLSQRAEPLLQEVLTHSFNAKLFEGTLHPDNFRYFLANDAIYLREYARFLNIIAGRLEKPHHKSIFLQFASETVEAELKIHQTFEVEKLPAPCKSIAEYLAHLDQHVKHPHIGVAIASVLPCFWLYRELGKHMAIAQTDISHPYKLWVETYACPKFDGATELAINVLNEVSDNQYENDIRFAFLNSVKHEITFWEESYCFSSRSYRFTSV